MAPTSPGIWEPDEKFASAREPAVARNRRERRYVVDQPVLVFTLGNREPVRPAHVRDISTRGMQLLVDEPFSTGPQIRIRWNELEVKGRILYQHKYDREQYRIGVELSSSCETLLIEILASHASELRRTQELLAGRTAELQRTTAFLDLVCEAVIVTSAEGGILLWNEGAERLYGWSAEEAAGRQWSDIAGFPPDQKLRRHKSGAVVRVASRAFVQPAAQGLAEVLIYLERR